MQSVHNLTNMWMSEDLFYNPPPTTNRVINEQISTLNSHPRYVPMMHLIKCIRERDFYFRIGLYDLIAREINDRRDILHIISMVIVCMRRDIKGFWETTTGRSESKH